MGKITFISLLGPVDIIHGTLRNIQHGEYTCLVVHAVILVLLALLYLFFFSKRFSTI